MVERDATTTAARTAGQEPTISAAWHVWRGCVTSWEVQEALARFANEAVREVYEDVKSEVASQVLAARNHDRAVAVREEHDRLRNQIKALPLIDGDQGPLYNGGYANALHDVLALLGESTQEEQ